MIVVLVLVTSKIITYGVAKDYQKEINSLEPYANFNIENNDEKPHVNFYDDCKGIFCRISIEYAY